MEKTYIIPKKVLESGRYFVLIRAFLRAQRTLGICTNLVSWHDVECSNGEPGIGLLFKNQERPK